MKFLATLVLTFAAGAASAVCTDDCGFEPEPFLQAAALVQPALLSGPDFHVVPEVQVRGYMADFLIDTKFGPLHAESAQMLAIRVAEMPAIETLDRASRSGAFAAALTQAGTKTGAAVVQVITHPVATVTGLPAGVARYFDKQWELWSGRAQSLSDRTARQFENAGDPYQAPSGPMTAGRRALPDDDTSTTAEKKSRVWYARLGSESAREARRYLKYNSQRRAMAKRLGVDPNTSNPLLNDKLDTLAWAAVWGGFSGSKALGAISGVAADIIGNTGKLNDLVWTKTPEQLREINRKRLLAFCSDDFGVRAFLRRGGFSDSLRTTLAGALEILKPRSGCNELVELGAATRGEIEARFLVNALGLIKNQPGVIGGSPLVAGAAIVWRTPTGQLLLPLPVDYLTWNPRLAAFFDRPELRSANKTVLIGGNASMLAQRQLTQRGWSLVLRAPMAHPPAYADWNANPAQ